MITIRAHDFILTVALVAGFVTCASVSDARAAQNVEPAAGLWHAWMDCPGGELPFMLRLEKQGDAWHAQIVNGKERLTVPVVEVKDGKVVLNIDYYDSHIEARLTEDGKRMDGQWRKKGKGTDWSKLEFHATAGARPRFDVDADTATYRRGQIDGTWRVDFSKSDEPAVGLFEVRPDFTATGTFMTTTGDYRFLAGTFDGRYLNLSCFDGVHVFLFKAELMTDGSLKGDFWSRDTWHETWTAHHAEGFALPDAFTQTKVTGPVDLAAIKLPDADGKMHSLGDPEFAGKPMVIEIFGTWCPNCHDATQYLVELSKRYGDKGLRIVGLAFELTNDFERDARQVRTYAKRLHVLYPILIGGMADKDRVASVVPFIDGLHSYPTTIFIDAKGKVRGIHTGYAGPATGVHYLNQKAKFESIIKSMLEE